jgi:serine/threonine protein kinase
MSPEQALGDVSDARSDLFSLGVVLYHLLCGDHPFVRGTPAETMKAIAHSDVPSLPARVHLPPSVLRLLSALLARSVDARPPDADSALDVLRPIARRLKPVGDVVQALLRDPQAFRDAPPIDDVDDVSDADTTVAEDDDSALADHIVAPIIVDVTVHDGHDAPAEPMTNSVDKSRPDALELVAGAARGERRQRFAVVLLLGAIMLSLVLAMWWATSTTAL